MRKGKLNLMLLSGQTIKLIIEAILEKERYGQLNPVTREKLERAIN